MISAARTFLIAAVCAVLAACATTPLAYAPLQEREAIAGNLMRDISVLASDEFGGRRPGTEGEVRTVNFLIEEMEKAGFVSGTNDPGSAWRAPVELVSTKALESEITIRTEAGEFIVPAAQGFAFSGSRRALIDGVDVFYAGTRGYDLTSEEVAGNIVVILADPQDSAEQRRGAIFAMHPAAVITVVKDRAAVSAARFAFGAERTILANQATDRLSAFVTEGMMERAFPDGGWQEIVATDNDSDTATDTLRATIAIDARTSRRDFTSSNVLAVLPGTVPGSGAVLLFAHWDHLGECGSEGAVDRICNGAIDNASGIASMLELARRLSAAGPHDRDIYLLATTAEEAGLFGARAFTETPPIPLESIVAAFNFDSVAIAPAGSPVGFVGEGRTGLDTTILEVLEGAGRQLGDRDYAESFVRRQDGWALLEKGVPAVFLSTSFSSQIVLGPYLAGDYHRPSDEAGEIELGGAVDDVLLHEELIRRIADTELYAPLGQ